MGRNEFARMNSGKAKTQTALFQVDFRLVFATFNALTLLYTPAEKSQKNNRKKLKIFHSGILSGDATEIIGRVFPARRFADFNEKKNRTIYCVSVPFFSGAGGTLAPQKWESLSA
jgi:hypothetical protein